MNCFVIKGKVLIMAFAVIALATLAAAGSGIREVFLSGSRNLPVYSVERDDTKIALTFNCAWNDDDIDEILKQLDRYNVKATFFIVGDWAEKYPESLKKVVQAGHEVGEHSYDHKDYTGLSGKEIAGDMEKTAAVIKETAGVMPKYVRVPSGAYNNSAIAAIESEGYIPIQWSVDSLDYRETTCEEIFERCTKNTVPGDIILMHNGTKNTAVALPRILDSLCSKYELVTISELIYDDNFTIDNTGKMKLK